MRLYITWTRYWVTPNQCIDFDNLLMKRWKQIGLVMEHLPFYGEHISDPRRLAVLNIPDSDSDKKDKILLGISHFEPIEITKEKALELCHAWYPEDVENIVLEGDTIYDYRPKEELF